METFNAKGDASAGQPGSAPADDRRRWPLGLLLPLLIFALVQLALALTVDLPEYDEAIYLDVARNVRRTGIATRSMGDGLLYADHTPLYQYFLGASSAVLGERVFFLRLLTVLFGVGCLVLVYAAGRRLRGPLAGTSAAIILALNPFFNLYSYFLRAEVPMLFFILAGVYWLVRYEGDGRARWLTWAGIAAAIAFLLRENALIFTAAATLYLLLTGSSWRQRLVNTIRLASPTLFAIALWLGWILLLSPDSLRQTIDRYLTSASGSSSAILDGRAALALGDWLNTLASQVIGRETLLLLVIAFLLYLLWRPRLPRFTWLLLLYLGLLGAYALLVSLREPRHVLPATALFALLIPLLVDWPRLLLWFRSRQLVRDYPRLTALVLAVVALSLAWGLLPLRQPPAGQWSDAEAWWNDAYQIRMFHNDRNFGIFRPVGDYLKQVTPPDETIIVVHEGTQVGYFADRSYLFLYTSDFAGVMQLLATTNYLVYDGPSFFRLSPEEVQRVEAYIADHFTVDQAFDDPYRQVLVYRRSAAP